VSAKALLEELRGRDLELTTDGDRLRPSRRSSPAASRKIRACLGIGMYLLTVNSGRVNSSSNVARPEVP
jgi:hypothetical protein